MTADAAAKMAPGALDLGTFEEALGGLLHAPQVAALVGRLLIELSERETEAAALRLRLSEYEQPELWDKRQVARLIDWIGREMNLGREAICGEGRGVVLVTARQAVSWAARSLYGYSYPRIARALGDRDHTTIMEQLRRAERRRDTDPDFKDLSDRLKAAFEVQP